MNMSKEINSKICTGCKEDKLFDQFTKASLGKYGLRAKCKSCRASDSIIHNSTRKEKISVHGKKYRTENKERISVQRAIHTANNKERLAAYGKLYRKTNPGKVNARTAKRRAARIKATPKWTTKEMFKEMEVLYIEAVRLTLETGIPHEVDHIVPLQGENVSGLHVPCNLRVIPRTDNRRKYNKL